MARDNNDIGRAVRVFGEASSLASIRQRALTETEVLGLLLPGYLKPFVPFIQDNVQPIRDYSLEFLLGLEGEGRLSGRFSSPEARRAVFGHYGEVRRAVYKFCLIKDTPEVVLMHAYNAGNRELALWAGAMLSLEDSTAEDNQEALIRAVNLGVADAAAGMSACRLFSLRQQYLKGPF